MSTNAARQRQRRKAQKARRNASQRAYWNRVKHGKIVLRVTLDEAVVLAALAAIPGLLAPLDADDREKVNAAYQKFSELVLSADVWDELEEALRR